MFTIVALFAVLNTPHSTIKNALAPDMSAGLNMGGSWVMDLYDFVHQIDGDAGPFTAPYLPILIGSPPQRSQVAIDTGSGMLWLNSEVGTCLLTGTRCTALTRLACRSCSGVHRTATCGSLTTRSWPT